MIRLFLVYAFYLVSLSRLELIQFFLHPALRTSGSILVKDSFPRGAVNQ